MQRGRYGIVAVVIVALLASCSSPATEDGSASRSAEAGSGISSSDAPTAWLLGYRSTTPAPGMSATSEPREVWSRDTDEMIDHHVVLDDKLVYLTRTAPDAFDLVAVSLADGAELWRTSYSGNVWPSTAQEPPSEGGEASDVISALGDLILLHTSDTGYRAVDPGSGELIWQLNDPDYGFGEPTGEGTDACLRSSEAGPTGESGTTCFRVSDGERAWWAPGYAVGASGSTVYLQSDAGVAGVDLATGEAKWQVLGAQGSVVEVGDMAVICDTTISGVDATGLRQWDVTSEGSPTCWQAGDDVLVKDGETLRLLNSTNGELVAEYAPDEESFYPFAAIGDVYLGSGDTYGSGLALDVRSRTTAQLPPAVERSVVRDGVISLVNVTEMDSVGPGSWSIAGGDSREFDWTVDVGWTRPVLEPTDAGLLVIALGHGGNLWFGTSGAAGPSLTDAVRTLGAPRNPPDGPLLDGQSVLGVPFGTPMTDARATLSELLGPPSSWNEYPDPNGNARPRLMWGTLEVLAETDPGQGTRITGWRDRGRGWSSGFAIAGGVFAWSDGPALGAAGFTEVSPTEVCREAVCFESYYGSGDAKTWNVVQAPALADATP